MTTPWARTGENPLEQANDRIYMILFTIALVTGAAFSLGSVGYLLGFNATTLVYIALGFSTMSGNYWLKGANIQTADIQLQWTSLAIIPIALRWAMQMPFFDQLAASTTNPTQQLQYMAQVVGLWILVAVAEEAFRAAMLNAADLFTRFTDKDIQDRYRVFFANTVWVVFHFFQRPLDLNIYWKYILWLYAAGLVMTYALIKAGMGAATLIHIIVNLTA